MAIEALDLFKSLEIFGNYFLAAVLFLIWFMQWKKSNKDSDTTRRSNDKVIEQVLNQNKEAIEKIAQSNNQLIVILKEDTEYKEALLKVLTRVETKLDLSRCKLLEKE